MNEPDNNSISSDNKSSNSIHEIYEQTPADRKAEIANKIKFGDSLTKIVLSVAFWGFWVFWVIVALTGI